MIVPACHSMKACGRKIMSRCLAADDGGQQVQEAGSGADAYALTKGVDIWAWPAAQELTGPGIPRR